MPVLQKSLADQRDAGKELEGYIAALIAKKREMEQALRDYVAARGSHTVGQGPSGGPGTSRGKSEDRVANAGAVFDRVLAKQTGLSGLTSAATGAAVKLRELQDLQRQPHRGTARAAKARPPGRRRTGVSSGSSRQPDTRR